MARLPLVLYPDTILRTQCADVTDIDQTLVDFGHAMAETMYLSNGIGLAAPQVARNIRLITVDVARAEGETALMHLVNPVIVDSHGRTTYEEGCLSFPGISAEVRRKDQIHVQAYDLQGAELDFDADGLLSICIQHELDHLNGVTFVDRLSPVKKKLVLRQYLKIREEDQEDESLAAIRAVHGE
ncbi:MAG: peptide deformylase [Deltaproteobacteria bacterium]|nr:peptide deformylase [Deltaproteobacteria bacterium]MCB9788063.1 peptide deformylase [Deltaproteobacteria bacterium]